jgi:calcineurin-like phosphoesterase family protein
VIWFTSDTHYGHDNVIQFCGRPFKNSDEMAEELITRFNSKVGESDTVYFLGDIFWTQNGPAAFQRACSFMSRLNGSIRVLVQGNHDKFSQAQYLKMGFTHVVQECVLKLAGHRVRLSHYPRRPPWWTRLFKKNARILRYMDRRPPKDGLFLLHGHTHSVQHVNEGRKEIHVGVDAWNYYPVSLSQIESIIARNSK